VRCRQAHSAEQMVSMAEQDLVRRGLLKPRDVLGVVAGTRQASGSTNLMRLHVVTEQETESIVHPAANRPSSSRHSAQSRISGGAKNPARVTTESKRKRN
jgi:hypothetical protein